MKELRILSDAADDVEKASEFYDRQEEGIGNYFLEIIFSELHQLSETAGIHPVFYGYPRINSEVIISIHAFGVWILCINVTFTPECALGD